MDSAKRTHWQAVAYLALTSACFATLDTLTKYTASFAPVAQTIWMRYAVQAVMMSVWWAIWLRPQSGLAFFRTRHPRFHLVRAALMIACTVLSFVGLRYMPVGEFTAVAFLSPMIAMLLSGWLLKEYVAPAQGWLAGLAFVGAVIVIRPGADIFGWAVLFALGVALFNGLFQLLTRRLASADEHPVFAQWIVGCVGLLLSSVALVLPGSWRWDLAAGQWVAMLAIGLLGALGHFFLMKAFALDTAPALAPYSYVQIVFAMLGGWLVFAHVPDSWAIAGMLVIVASGFASGFMRAQRSTRVAQES
ncbi:MAG: DMT family transporter [Rhodoferax sp.]|nr:DMT family transporter [Rhodoferax sp.]